MPRRRYMKPEIKVQQFAEAMSDQYGDTPIARYYTACFESCIPRKFWKVSSDQVNHNVNAFKQYVCGYTRRMSMAIMRGYGQIYLGDNGAGKTMFINFILTQAIKRGRSAYYTTLAQLDADIKRGFRDKAADDRLTEMLEADIVAIDELGKEHYRSDSWLLTQLEQLLKRRYDDNAPVLLASNLAFADIVNMYGPSIESMLEGRYAKIMLEAGDFRRSESAKMRKDMAYK